jgi:hypothetical protein
MPAGNLNTEGVSAGTPTASGPTAGATTSGAAAAGTAATGTAATGTAATGTVPAGGSTAGEPHPLTRTQGAALAPEPTPDGKAIYFLALKPSGLELRRLDLAARRPALPPPDAPPGLVPAVRPPLPPPPAPFALAEAAAGRPYGVGRQELLPILGGGGSPAGGTFELGVRSGDIVGRLDLLALGALGSGGRAQGGALAAAWRGWPVEIGFHLFSVSEHPERQGGRVPAGAGELAGDRRGGELSASWRGVGEGSRFELAARVLGEDAGFTRRSLSLGGAWAAQRRAGSWRGRAEAHARVEAGSSAAQDWQRFGGGFELAVRRGGSGAALSFERDGSRQARRALDLYSLGGAPVSELPASALAGRIAVPALPEGAAFGAQHESARAEVELGALPLPIFYERHRLWGGPGRPVTLSLAGLEYRLSLDPYPLVRLPRLDLRLGAGRILTGPLARETRWWVTTVWSP